MKPWQFSKVFLILLPMSVFLSIKYWGKQYWVEQALVIRKIINFAELQYFYRLNVTDDNMRKEHSKQLIKRRKLAKKQAQQQQQR